MRELATFCKVCIVNASTHCTVKILAGEGVVLGIGHVPDEHTPALAELSKANQKVEERVMQAKTCIVVTTCVYYERLLSPQKLARLSVSGLGIQHLIRNCSRDSILVAGIPHHRSSGRFPNGTEPARAEIRKEIASCHQDAR